MIEITIIENHEIQTHRTAILLSDGRYMITEHPSGDTWFVEHAKQAGLNVLARKILVKPRAGVKKL